MARLWNAGVRIAKKPQNPRQLSKPKMKAAIKAYGLASTAEKLVKTDLTALRYKLAGDDDMGMISGTFFNSCTIHFVLNMKCLFFS